MNRKLAFVLGGAAFWGAVLLAFWLGSKSQTREAAAPEGRTDTRTRHSDAIPPKTPGGSAGSSDRIASRADPVGTGAGANGGQASGPGSGKDPAVGKDPASAEGLGEDLGARDMAPGEIVELNYEFADAQQRREHELDQKARWEKRKAAEIEQVSGYLARELKLDSLQASRLQTLLIDESSRRVVLVTDMTEGRIDQVAFRRRVDEIRETARRELDGLFTPEQMAQYKTLEPRKQVLLEGTISGR